VKYGFGLPEFLYPRLRIRKIGCWKCISRNKKPWMGWTL